MVGFLMARPPSPDEDTLLQRLSDPAILSDIEFRKLSIYIESELGIRMPDTKRVMLESRLQKRLRHLGLRSFTEYIEYVFSPGGSESELMHMIDSVTTNKTDFFRENEHFEYLIEAIVPNAAKNNGAGHDRPFQAWSAGCSTGEEPYSIAMVLEEHRRVEPQFTFRIFASDLSTQVLEKAREAIYEEEKVAAVPMSFKKKYLLKSKDKNAALVRIRPELRSAVTFARINFMDDSYDVPDFFDVIFCRNVIIYFERHVQIEILGKLCSRLRQGGWLILGHSETLTGMGLALRSVAPAIYQKH